MQTFELHFNPKNGKEDKLFDSFVYEPENASEKRLGNLYIVGELTRAMPQNARFLDNLAQVLKKEYYAASLQKSCEASLKEALKKANEFLDKEARKGNVNWLGNLHFAVLNFKDYVLNFTKVGGIKILISRDGDLLDVGQNLEFQEADPYPLKVFGSVATGKLASGDKIILLTKDVFQKISENGSFLNKLKDISNEKELKEILKINKLILSEVSGICLLLVMGTEEALSREPKEKITFLNKKRWWPRFPSFKLFPSFEFKLPQIRFPSVKIARPPKSISLIIALFLILAAGFFVFDSPKEYELQTEDRQKLELAKSKVHMAENFMIFKEEEKSENLLLEAKNIIASLIQSNSLLQEEAASLQETIESYLK